MYTVNNHRTISMIAKKSFQANRIRNLFTLIAIVLTTVLFTSLFTIGMSLVKSMELSRMRLTGGSAHGSFKDISQPEFNALESHLLVKGLESDVYLGSAENSELTRRPTEIRHGSERMAEWRFSNPTTGRMPQACNEIAVDTIILDYLSIPHELGQALTLEYTLGSEKVIETFFLTGFWEGDWINPGSTAWVSKQYLEDQLINAVLNPEDLNGRMDAYVMFENSINLESKFNQVIEESGFSLDDIEYGVNWAYLSTSNEVDPLTISFLLGYLLLFVICGYLMIYNIFYIYISRDIRFFGQLKTIGTTSRQIRQMITIESILLCAIGIPAGLAAGYFVGVWLAPAILGHVNIAAIEISANPLIFIGSGLFALVTVFVSTRSPINIASKVSPMDAVRTTDADFGKQAKGRMEKKINLWRLAVSNVFRNGRRASLVTLSLGLSLIILNFSVVILRSFNIENYVRKVISADFLIADTGIFNVLIGFDGKPSITEEFIEELTSQAGIQKMGMIRFSEHSHPIDSILQTNLKKISANLSDRQMVQRINRALDNEVVDAHIYGIDPMTFDDLIIHSGSFDLEKFKSGDYVIVSAYGGSDLDQNSPQLLYQVGDRVTISFTGGSTKVYEVLAVANLPYNLTVQHGSSYDPDFLIPNQEFSQQLGQVAPMKIMLDTAEESTSQIEAWLTNYCEKINPDLYYKSMGMVEAEFYSTQRAFLSILMVLTAIITAIGILNLVNTTVTSIIARHHELAVMQSIGLTTKQLRWMLIFEGLTYAVMVSCLALTFGNLVVHFGLSTITNITWLFEYQFTLKPLLLSIPALFLLTIVIPIGCYAFTNKHSIVDQLRKID